MDLLGHFRLALEYFVVDTLLEIWLFSRFFRFAPRVKQWSLEIHAQDSHQWLLVALRIGHRICGMIAWLVFTQATSKMRNISLGAFPKKLRFFKITDFRMTSSRLPTRETTGNMKAWGLLCWDGIQYAGLVFRYNLRPGEVLENRKSSYSPIFATFSDFSKLQISGCHHIGYRPEKPLATWKHGNYCAGMTFNMRDSSSDINCVQERSLKTGNRRFSPFLRHFPICNYWNYRSL